MRKILFGLTILGAGALIALGARKGLREHAGATPVASAATTSVVDGAGVTGVPDSAGEAVGSLGASAEGAGSAAATAGNQVAPRSAEGTVRTDRGPTNPVEPPVPLTVAGDQELATVLRRAAGAYAEARSLQANFSQRSMNPILRTTVASQGTLYQRRPDRFLMRFSDPAGDLIVSDGSYFWVYYPSVDRKQVLRMPASMGAGGVDLQAQFVGDPLARFTAISEGREEVSGRSTYVLLLTPRQPIGYRSLKVWIDAEDYLVRRFEVTEESGIVRYFELSELRLNPTLSDDLFRFTPPEGAQVVDRG